MNRNLDNGQRPPSGMERHAQTVIQVIIVLLIGWAGTELRDIGKDVATMKAVQNMMLERLLRVEAQARDTREEQLRMQERIYGHQSR